MSIRDNKSLLMKHDSEQNSVNVFKRINIEKSECSIQNFGIFTKLL